MNKLLLALGLILTCGLANAGVVNGGGGKGVLCSSADGSVKSVEALDLFEAQNLYGLTLVPALKDVDTQIDSAMKRLSQLRGLPDDPQYLHDLKASFQFTAKGVHLDPTADSLEVFNTPNCQLVQVINYVQDSQILVDSEYWNAMSPLNQAALVFHELIYRMARFDGYKDSRLVRQLVGNLFSTAALKTSVPSSGAHKKCFSNVPGVPFEFDAYQACSDSNPNSCMTTLDFSKFGGLPMIESTTAVLVAPSMPIGVANQSQTGATIETSVSSTVFDPRASDEGAGNIQLFFSYDPSESAKSQWTLWVSGLNQLATDAPTTFRCY